MVTASTPLPISACRSANSAQPKVWATKSRCLRSGSTTPTSSTPAISDNTRAWLLPMTPTPTTPIFNGLHPSAPPLAWPNATGDPHRTEPEHVLLPILTGVEAQQILRISGASQNEYFADPS